MYSPSQSAPAPTSPSSSGIVSSQILCNIYTAGAETDERSHKESRNLHGDYLRRIRPNDMACTGLHPRVAVIAIISDEDGRIVAGRRIGPLGTGQWSFPGGHVDQGEDLFACAERETLEETGLKVRAVKVVAVTNDVFVEANKHYVSIFMKCERIDPQQQPQRIEPNKCEGWSWKSWHDIKTLVNIEDKPQEVFLPVQNLVRENPQIDIIVGCG